MRQLSKMMGVPGCSATSHLNCGLWRSSVHTRAARYHMIMRSWLGHWVDEWRSSLFQRICVRWRGCGRMCGAECVKTGKPAACAEVLVKVPKRSLLPEACEAMRTEDRML